MAIAFYIVKLMKAEGASISDVLIVACYLPLAFILGGHFLRKLRIISPKGFAAISSPSISFLIVGTFHVMWMKGGI